MGDIFTYLEKYGDLTFKEEPFNEVDNVILSVLTYIDYEGIVSSKKDKKTLLEVGNLFFKKYGKNKKYLKQQILAVRSGIKVLKIVKEKKRFKDILMYNYLYEGNDSVQFSAITFEIEKNLLYVAFEGTDQLLSGWEEDFKMAYYFPVDAQKKAIQYLNKTTFENKKIIVGGHSKGGNLAQVSAMYTNFLVKKKILKIYSNDGQGLRLKQFKSPQYKSIKNKFIHIIPSSSIVGLLLRHDRDYEIVKSNKIGLEAHNALTWVVEGKQFKRAKLSVFSQIFESGLEEWLDKYDDNQRKIFVTKLFDIFRENNINSLLDFQENKKNIIKILKSYMNVDKEISDMIKDLLSILNHSHIDYYLNTYFKQKENEVVN